MSAHLDLQRALKQPLGRCLPRFNAHQCRWLGPKAAMTEMLPFTNQGSWLRALSGSTRRLDSGMCLAFRDDQGQDHLQMDLPDGALSRLGLPDVMLQRLGWADTLRLLTPACQQALRWASMSLGKPLSLCGSPLGQTSSATGLPWRFSAGGLPRLGTMRLAVSTTLLEALGPVPQRVLRGRALPSRVKVGWSLQIDQIALARHERDAIEPGDLLTCTNPFVSDGRARLALWPEVIGPLRWATYEVDTLLSSDGSLQLRLPPHSVSRFMMETPPSLDALTVPVELLLPLLPMSLAEIEGVRVGSLVDTGHALDGLEVQICSAGQVFGIGRLVAIGDSLGVEVLKCVGGSKS